jgi:hypothetical protein
LSKTIKFNTICLLLSFFILLSGCKSDIVRNTTSITKTISSSSITDQYSKLQQNAKPICEGSFIQSWLFTNWTDERWGQELQYMKDSGMKYLILAPAAAQDKDGKWNCLYPTNIPEIKSGYNGKDYIETVLSNCQKYGIKLFLGLELCDSWWSTDISNSQVLFNQMDIGNKIADELYAKYHQKYKDTFYGWYWTPELANYKTISKTSKTREQTIKVFSDELNINLDHLTKIDSSMPLMLSPYYVTTITSADENYQFWADLLKITHFREGDILCPQDSIGAGGGKLDSLDTWLKSFRKAVDTKPGLKFWVNNETFVQTDWSSASLSRFITQMKISSKYAEHLISFSFCHYYSPFNVVPDFYNTYKKYLNVGKLDKTPPSSPKNVSAKATGLDVKITWSASVGKNGISGYNVYRNKKLICSFHVKRDDGSGTIPQLVTECNDNISFLLAPIIYYVEAIDCVGNVSAKAAFTYKTKN